MAGQPNVQTAKPSIEPTNIEGSIGTPRITEFRVPTPIPLSTPIPRGRSIHNRIKDFSGSDLVKVFPAINISFRYPFLLGGR
jgi:hypothetical protein